jgi:hypothetical protein
MREESSAVAVDVVAKTTRPSSTETTTLDENSCCVDSDVQKSDNSKKMKHRISTNETNDEKSSAISEKDERRVAPVKILYVELAFVRLAPIS